MKATETRLLPFFKKSQQFKVPIYQRTYSWTERECLQLLEDIISAGQNDKISVHFIGSIVYIEEGLYHVTNQTALLVIDGQQRLATLTLLLAAIAEILGEDEPVDGFCARKLKNYYLLNVEETGDSRYKLLLSKTDKESLISIVGQKAPPDNISINITQNYEMFKKKLAQHDDLSVVCKGLNKLMLVDIALSRDNDNPQLIFESMNSTGLKLSQADLIRNYILMGLEPVLQEQLYNEFWRPMEESFGQKAYNTHFDSFMRHYLTAKTVEIPRVNDVYEAFKKYSQSPVIMDAGITDLVSDIREFAKYYCAMELGAETDEVLNTAFQDLRELKIDVAYPFLLKLYQDYIMGRLLKKEFVEVIKLIEAYVFRRAICSIPTNSLNMTFANFTKSVDENQYLVSIKAHFLLLRSYRRFPSDKEFKDNIQTHDLYNFRSRIYWLRRFENYNRKERVPVGEYTIEHIMPQNEILSKEWQMALGNDWKIIHQSYLHTLGNLTLTGYNSEYSNKSFQEKRDMDGGFRESPLKVNEGLKEIEVWNEEAIKSRSLKLATWAMDVWRSPNIPEDALIMYQNNMSKVGGYTIKNHHHLQNSSVKELFDAFSREVMELNPCVSMEFFSHHVVYKAETNFVHVEPQAEHLQLLLNIGYSEIRDPKFICNDVSNLGTAANGDVEVILSVLDDLPYVIGLVRQSLDMQLGNENDG